MLSVASLDGRISPDLRMGVFKYRRLALDREAGRCPQ